MTQHTHEYAGRAASKGNPCPLCGHEDWCWEIANHAWMCGRTDEHDPPGRWKWNGKLGRDGRPIFLMGNSGHSQWRSLYSQWERDWGESRPIDDINELSAMTEKQIDEAFPVPPKILEENKKAEDYEQEFEELLPEIDKCLKMQEPLKSFALSKLARKNHVTVSSLVSWAFTARQKKLAENLTLDQFEDVDFGEQEFLIGGLVPTASCVLVTAAPGVGKSSFVYAIAKSVLDGTPFDGRYSSKEKVLILQGDEGKRNTQRKLAKLNIQNKHQCTVSFERNFADMYGLERYIEEGGYKLIIADSYSTLNRYSGYEEKDTSFALAAMEIRAMCDRLGCTFLLIHHLNKSGTTRGTTALEANVDEIWRITKESDASDGQRYFTFNKSRAELSGHFKCSWDAITGQIHMAEEDDDPTPTNERPASIEEKMLVLFSQKKGSFFELQELTIHPYIASSYETVRRSASKLYRDGKVIRERRKVGDGCGKWYYVYGVPRDTCTTPPVGTGGSLDRPPTVPPETTDPTIQHPPHTPTPPSDSGTNKPPMETLDMDYDFNEWEEL